MKALSPIDTLNHLKSISSARAQRTLDAIFEVCNERLSQGERDFSIATISRIGSKRGVPAAQSIRNKTGENYRILIESFVTCLPERERYYRESSANAWIEEIKDLKLRFLVRVQAAQLAEAQRIVKEIIPPGLEVFVDDRRLLSEESRLNHVERRALEYLVSNDFLEQQNFRLGDFGDVLDERDLKVFKPGTIDAVKKALIAL